MSLLAVERRVVEGAVPIEVLSAGAGEARSPIVFVHGAYVGAWCWAEHWLPWFAEGGHEVHALSLRGHGRSGGREALHEASLGNYAQDLAAVVDDLGRTPILVGHSMGALVAQKYLERAHCERLALLCPVPPAGLVPATFAMLFSRPTLFAEIQSMALGQRLAPARVQEALFGGTVDEALLARVCSRLQPESRRALLDMSGLGMPRRSRLNLPRTLVIGAGRDALFPAAQVEFAARWLDAEYRSLPGLGHALMLDAEWRSAAECLRDWLAPTD